VTSLRSRPAPWLAAAVAILGVALVLAAVTLARPSDAVAAPRLLALGWLLLPLVGATAYLSTRWAWLAAAGVVLPQLLAGGLAVREATDTGRTGGWALFVAEVPWAVIGLGLIAVLVGWLARYAAERELGALDDAR
jgi:hypothetical protein